MYQLIDENTLATEIGERGKQITRHILPANATAPAGKKWVQELPFPVAEPAEGNEWIENRTIDSIGWIEAIKPIEEPEEIEVTKAQLRTALTDTQIAQIEGFISLIPDATLKRLAANYWEHNITYLQFDPLLVRMAAGLQGHIGSGWTPDDVATIFIAAKAITTGVNDSI